MGEVVDNFIEDIKNSHYTNKDPIASMIPYFLEDVAYALDIKAEPKLRKRVAAAIASYKNEVPFEEMLASMNDADYSDDNSLNRYARIRDLIIETSYMASQVIEKYFKDNFEKNKHSFAQSLFVFSMERLWTSFQAAVLLLNSGFFVEVTPIFRQIYEQFAWACYLIQEKDDTRIAKNQTQSDVNYLKAALKNDDYGKLYGYLSNETHLEPKSITKYLLMDGDTIRVKHRSGEGSNEATLALILLLKMFGEVIHHGMKSFGYPKTDSSYFNCWFEAHLTVCDYLHKAFDGKCNFVRAERDA